MALIKYCTEQVGKDSTTTTLRMKDPHRFLLPILHYLQWSELVKYVYDNFIYYYNFISTTKTQGDKLNPARSLIWWIHYNSSLFRSFYKDTGH